jgi:hypothetical protein
MECFLFREVLRSIRRATLKGVSRVSRIKSLGVATPSSAKVSRSKSGFRVRRVWHSRMAPKNSSVENERLRTVSSSSTKRDFARGAWSAVRGGGLRRSRSAGH